MQTETPQGLIKQLSDTLKQQIKGERMADERMEQAIKDSVADFNIVMSIQKRFECSMNMASEAYKCVKKFMNENAICDHKATYSCNCQ